MRFAHVSDLHLQPSSDTSPGAWPSSMDVAVAVASDLAAIAETLDLVVVSGDLTEHADAGSFAAFEEIFAGIGLPVVVVPGNHDGPEGMRRYEETSARLAAWDITNRAVEIGHLRFVGLNTSVEGLTTGALDGTALSLVEAQLRRTSDEQFVIVMHHPPLTLGQEQFDAFSQIERGKEFLGILAETDRPVLVLSGHVHRPFSARQGNIACFVAGSMIAPYDSALPFGHLPIRPARLQDFYFIHEIGPDGRHVVTPQRVRGLAERDGPTGAAAG